jgi:hypothetical protein
MNVFDKLKSYVERANLMDEDLAYLTTLLKEAQRDQRHGCAEAVNTIEGKSHTFGTRLCIRKDEAYQAVFNAKAEVERANEPA